MSKHKNVMDIQDRISARFIKQAKHNNTSDPAAMSIAQQIEHFSKNKTKVVPLAKVVKPRFARYSKAFYGLD